MRKLRKGAGGYSLVDMPERRSAVERAKRAMTQLQDIVDSEQRGEGMTEWDYGGRD